MTRSQVGRAGPRRAGSRPNSAPRLAGFTVFIRARALRGRFRPNVGWTHRQILNPCFLTLVGILSHTIIPNLLDRYIEQKTMILSKHTPGDGGGGSNEINELYWKSTFRKPPRGASRDSLPHVGRAKSAQFGQSWPNWAKHDRALARFGHRFGKSCTRVGGRCPRLADKRMDRFKHMFWGVMLE